MDRYTKRLYDGQAVMDCENCQVNWAVKTGSGCTALYCRNRLKDRVADYEDTGLDPQEIKKIRQDVEAGFLKQTARRYGVDVDRIRELVEADQDGRCVVLPCKLHDKVFFVENGCVKETEVDSFQNWTSGRWKMSTHTDRMYDHWKGYEIDFSSIGKIVFLTRKAAEAALKGETHEDPV